MKKICFIKSDFNGGGTERVTSLIANNLAQNTTEFKIYILDIANPQKEVVYNLDEKITHHSLSSKNHGKLSVIYNNFRLYKFLKTREIDVLINVQAMMGIHSLLPTIFTDTKNIVWEHANYYQKQGTRVINLVRQIELFFANYYIVLTKRDKKNFENNFICKAPIDYIYNPMPDIKKEIPYSENSKIIMSAGHLTNIKGFDMLLKVAEIVLNVHTDWKWEIYGEGKEKKNLERKIEELGLEGKVILCGRTNHIEENFKKSSMYVLTSRMEGLPMVLLEAKANRLPIISFDIETGPSEIVKDGQDGYLIDPFNINEMAGKIIFLIENDNVRKEMSIATKNNFSQFNVDKIIRKWKLLLSEL